MSLSRPPSPRRGGGWSSPKLVDAFGQITPAEDEYEARNGPGMFTDAWASAKARSDQVGNAQSFSARTPGFFLRQKRKISASLPRFSGYEVDQRKRRFGQNGQATFPIFSGGGLLGMKTLMGNILRKGKGLVLVLFVIAVVTVLWSQCHVSSRYRRAAQLGGGSKFVIILAANQGGGVMEWKGPREWAIERESVKNKKQYAARWGYDLEIVDMSTKKRYAHEWRESWERVDMIRSALKKYPDAEWFWWLDLNTFIMEPSRSLQSHLFDRLDDHTYRDINEYNPLNITHPPVGDYLDHVSLSAVGDNRTESIDLLIGQDCAGFTLGSFFVHRSPWTDRLLDVWWDPVIYEQKHMQWAHKEQDALQHLYTAQPWVRTHTAFVPQRKLNSYPPGACGGQHEEPLDPRIHYRQQDRDFLVNLAGCEWGRDCWGEMHHYREVSHYLNRSRWEKFKDWLRSKWSAIVKQDS